MGIFVSYTDTPNLQFGFHRKLLLLLFFISDLDINIFAHLFQKCKDAAGTYERARLEGYTTAGAQELAMNILLEGLRYSKYAILREVVENEFSDDVPEAKRESFTKKLLPLVGNVFSIYDLSDDKFALSPDYDLLYTELTGAAVLYIEEYGV